MSDSFETLFQKALAAAGRTSGPSLKKAENEVIAASHELERELDNTSTMKNASRVSKNNDTFYDKETGSPGRALEMNVRGPDNDFLISLFIERRPDTWKGYWHARVHHGQRGVSGFVMENTEAETSGTRAHVMKALLSAYKHYIDTDCKELVDLVESHADRNPW